MAHPRCLTLLFLYLTLPAGCLLVPNVLSTTQEIIIMEADRDAYISYQNANQNFGGLPYMLFGYYVSDPCVAWLHFNLTYLPPEYLSVVLRVNVSTISQAFTPRWSTYIQYAEYSEHYDWKEYDITWTKGPQLGGGTIESFSVAASGIYSFDVTPMVRSRSNQTAGLSVVFNPAQVVEPGYGYISSRESGSPPRLEVTYMVGGSNTGPESYVGWVIGGLVAAALGSLLGFTYLRRSPWFMEWRRAREVVRQPVPPPACPLCRHEIPPGTGICPHCGQHVT